MRVGGPTADHVVMALCAAPEAAFAIHRAEIARFDGRAMSGKVAPACRIATLPAPTAQGGAGSV